MKKIGLFILVILISMDMLVAESKFEIDFVTSYKTGKGINEFATVYNKYLIDGAGDGPSIIYYDESKKVFYISDGYNKRLSVYDFNFKQIDEIDISNDIYLEYPHSIQIYKEGFILYQKYIGFTYHTWDGELQWQMNFVEKYYDNKLENNNFYYDEDNGIILFYMIDGEVICFSSLTKDSNGFVTTKGRDQINILIKNKDISNIKISESNKILVDNKIKSISGNDILDKDNDNGKRIYIGRNKNNYIYWTDADRRIRIYDSSKTFIISEIYREGYITGGSYMPGIHPSGDILYLIYNSHEVALKRIINTWDPKLREQWYKDHPNAK
ncbi:hypothetical protein EW093_05585 [Thiospirochaeta perfilievii]|uniref:6-bladed beta-propeller n=1 Tax=Thiospirochaeta perfilievii TaxID=252967 RepID=A0A5C1Q9Q1_9SPIO|nr:hypothetical protein [Thiospirochaeta perfilievii]QEN04197.1 hypothetical protein EW093_05585 [Thiospirochaeta perfilievii]